MATITLVTAVLVTAVAVVCAGTIQRWTSKRSRSAYQARAAASSAGAMQSRGGLATASSASVEGQNAPGDSAGGPSASYTGVQSEASPLGMGDSAAYSGNMTAAVAQEWAVDVGANDPGGYTAVSQDPTCEAGGRALRPEHSQAARAGNPAGQPMAAADSGGGHTAVRFDASATGDQPNGPVSPTAPRDDESGNNAPVQNGSDDPEAPQPLIIQAEASLMDGLRALLVHHLKRSVGTSVVSLSASQAELLEHHLSRLASYAQKIVHTLAFATRFLSKQNTAETNDDYAANAQYYGGGPPHNPQYRPGEGGHGGPTQQQPPEPRAPKKSLKLSDDEILGIYRSAQVEAAIEADWRGIPGTSRSSASAPSPAGPRESPGGDREYLQMLSRALQEPGRSPRQLTAEILDPSKGVVCCQPRAFGTPLHGGAPPPGPGGLQSAMDGSPSPSQVQSHRHGQSTN